MFALSYAEVFPVLASLHGIPDAKLVAFRGRIQHFQKLHFPDGVNTGRGTPAKYRAGQIVMLHLALELTQLGITPERAANLLSAKSGEIRQAVADTIRYARKPTNQAIYIGCDPALLTGKDPSIDFFDFRGLTAILEVRKHSPAAVTRLALINLTANIRRLAEPRTKGDWTKADFTVALAGWAGLEEE